MENRSKLVIALLWAFAICPELWKKTPFWNKANTAQESLMLVLVAAISGTAWACLLGQFSPIYVYLPVGIVAFAFMFLMDRLIAGSYWRLTGFIKRPGMRYGWAYGVLLAVRLAFAGVFSYATSTGAEMAMFGEAIKEQIVHQVQAENQKITAHSDAEINSLIKRELPQQSRVQNLQKLLAQDRPALDQAMQAKTDAEERVRMAGVELDRELTGSDGRRKGWGPKSRAAQADVDQAQSDLAKATSTVTILEPRVQASEELLRSETARYDDAKADLQPKLAKLEAERDANLQSPRQDIMLSYMALQNLKNDPNSGLAVRFFGSLMMVVLMAIEMSYVTIKTVFPQANIYMALQMKDAKERMEEIDDTAANDEHANDNRPPIRIISSKPPNDASG